MYQEILDIENFIKTNKFKMVLNDSGVIDDNLISITIYLGTKQYELHVSDEYNDLNHQKPALNFVIAFRAIAEINDSEDFLQWCNFEGLNPNNHKLLDYYKTTCSFINEVNKRFPKGELDYFISDLDFELNAGAMQFLRQ